MQSASQNISELYAYVWNSEAFFKSEHEDRIRDLIDNLSKNFHLNPGSWSQNQSFQALLRQHRETLGEIGEYFDEGNKELALSSLRSVTSSCSSCHFSIHQQSGRVSLPKLSFEAKSGEELLIAAEYLLATRDVEGAEEYFRTLAKQALYNPGDRQYLSKAIYYLAFISIMNHSPFEFDQKLPPRYSRLIKRWERDLSTTESPRELLELDPDIPLEEFRSKNLARTTLALRSLSPRNEHSEDSFIRAKASWLLPLDVYNKNSIVLLEQFLRTYPDSSDYDEAYELLSAALEERDIGADGGSLTEEHKSLLMQLKITVYDVGQGDYASVECGETIVIDGGNLNASQKIIENTPVIDKLVITHPHPDHIRGVLDAAKQGAVEIKTLYRSSLVNEDQLELDKFAQHLEVVEQQKTIPVCFSKSLQLKLSAPEADAFDCPRNLNDCGLVAFFTNGANTVGFFGDKTTRWFELSGDKLKDMNFNLVTASHHGNNSWPMSLLDEIDSDYYVISALPQENGNWGFLGYPRCENIPVTNEGRHIKCCTMQGEHCVWDQVVSPESTLFTAFDGDIRLP